MTFSSRQASWWCSQPRAGRSELGSSGLARSVPLIPCCFTSRVPEAGRRLLPLPVAAWHATVGARTVDGIAKGDAVLVHGQLVRRFYRSGAGARSMTEVVATGIKKLEQPAA